METGKLAAPFMKIKDACAATGLSKTWIATWSYCRCWLRIWSY